MRAAYFTALVLLVLGGLNWGYVGIAGIDVIALLFSQAPALMRTLYTLISFSAIYVGFCNLLWPQWVERNILNMRERSQPVDKTRWAPL